VLEMVELTGAERRRVKGYSLGMRQRLALAAALLGEPRILILDEPANGLDPKGMRWLRDLLRAQAAEGRTVLVSSHLLSEVAQTADELVVIRDGKLVAQGSMGELTAGEKTRIRVRASQPKELATALSEQGATVGSVEEGGFEVRGANGEQIGDLALRLGVAIYELAPQGSSLEESFFELMGEEGDDES
jgi:ABC-2 type transport system ATP-binding protein